MKLKVEKIKGLLGLKSTWFQKETDLRLGNRFEGSLNLVANTSRRFLESHSMKRNV